MAMWTKKKYLRLAKGFRGRSRNCPRTMMPRVEKSLVYSYIGRKLRRRTHRRDWISTVNSGVKEHNIRYSQFIFGLNRSNIGLDRKILASLAVNEPYSFKAIVDEIKIQANLSEKYKDDMAFIEAIDKHYLVYGPVKPLGPNSDYTIPFMGVRDTVPKEIRDKLKIISNEDLLKSRSS